MKLRFIPYVLLVLCIGGLLFTQIQKAKMKKDNKQLSLEISNLESRISDLKSEISNLEETNESLQDRLSEVKHFDEFSSYSTYSRSAVTYTGSAMETQIDGEFNGWEGETIFKMLNGSIWQQASYDYEYHYAYMPDVLIYRKGGSYYMRVEGVEDEIRVNRIK